MPVTPPFSFSQAGCPPCRPTNSVKALKAQPGDQRVYIQLPTRKCVWYGRTDASTLSYRKCTIGRLFTLGVEQQQEAQLLHPGRSCGSRSKTKDAPPVQRTVRVGPVLQVT